MNFSKTLACLAIASVSLGFAAPVLADYCGAISPNLELMGDDYYELGPSTVVNLDQLSHDEKNIIDDLGSSRFKRGEGTRTQCFGVSELRAETKQFSIKEIEPTQYTRRNEIVIQAWEHGSDDRSIRRSEVRLPLSGLNAISSSNNSLAVNARHRHTSKNLSGGSFTNFRETSTKVTKNSEGVHIVQHLYINGYLAEWFTWNLR